MNEFQFTWINQSSERTAQKWVFHNGEASFTLAYHDQRQDQPEDREQGFSITVQGGAQSGNCTLSLSGTTWSSNNPQFQVENLGPTTSGSNGDAPYAVSVTCTV